MARTTHADSQRTAQRILDCALEQFTDRGYAAVGLEDVASTAGVTRGAVYHHFGSKRGLFEAVLGRVQESIAESIESAAVLAGDDLWSQLEAGCAAFLRASTEPQARRIVLIEAPAVLDWQTWRDSDARYSGALLTAVLREVEAAGELAHVSVPAAAAALSGAMNEVALWIVGGGDDEAAMRESWVVLRRILNAMKVQPA